MLLGQETSWSLTIHNNVLLMVITSVMVPGTKFTVHIGLLADDLNFWLHEPPTHILAYSISALWTIYFSMLCFAVLWSVLLDGFLFNIAFYCSSSLSILDLLKSSGTIAQDNTFLTGKIKISPEQQDMQVSMLIWELNKGVLFKSSNCWITTEGHIESLCCRPKQVLTE